MFPPKVTVANSLFPPRTVSIPTVCLLHDDDNGWIQQVNIVLSKTIWLSQNSEDELGRTFPYPNERATHWLVQVLRNRAHDDLGFHLEKGAVTLTTSRAVR